MPTSLATLRAMDAVRYTLDDRRIEPCPTTGCWLWIGYMKGRSGYGEVSVRKNGKWVTSTAHRAVWQKWCGPVPEGRVLDHICRERSCVNPDHLRLVTPAQNVTENSLSPSARHKARVVCPKCGGQYTTMPTGWRRCVPCQKKYYEGRRARQLREIAV